MKVLKSRLTTLSLMYYRVVEEEQLLVNHRLRYENDVIDRLGMQMKLSQRLALFCLHVQHETRGSVVMKKLPSAHPQYLRCQRAATENVKKDFFKAEGSRFSGVEVLNVYKIENRILLDAFQSSAAASDPGKVKGLFCGVPLDCLETLIVYGMSGRPKDGTPLQHAFQDTWYEIHQKSNTKNGRYDSSGNDRQTAGGNQGSSSEVSGYAKKAVDLGSAIPFPRCFSRHSTLEEDRPLVNAPVCEQDVEGNDSPVRFLALCRVMIGKILVTSKNSRAFPAVTDSSYDSMYSPVQEEYKLLKDNYVLPEFLVQYQFKGKLSSKPKKAAVSANTSNATAEDILNGSGGRQGGDNDNSIGSPSGVGVGSPSGNYAPVVNKKDVFDIDLSSPIIEIPRFETRKEHKSNLSILAHPLARPSISRSGTRRDNLDSVDESAVATQGPTIPPTTSSAAHIDDAQWIIHRKNASKQKACIRNAIQDLFVEFHKLFELEKAKEGYGKKGEGNQ